MRTDTPGEPGDERARQQTLADQLREVNERLVIAGLREQELADQARTHAEQLDALVRSMNGGVVILNAEGDVTLVNAWASAMMELDKAGVPIRCHIQHGLDFRYPDDTPLRPEDNPFACAMRGERFTNVERILVRSDESRVRLSFNGSAIPNEATGSVDLAIVVFQDVTELRRLEQLRADYASLISHDLRAPLNAIMGYAELLDRRARSEGQHEASEQARRIGVAAGRMNAMIDDLVESTRLESGAVVLDRRPIDPVQLIEELVERIGSPEERRRLRVEVAGRLPTVLIDPHRIERAVTNLLTNALKYSPSDEDVIIRLERRTRDLLLSVTDRGPGIPPELLPKVFERFYTGSDATGRGIGLGLYIARLIVEAHGGRIWAESEEGRGTTVRMVLPLR